MEITVFAFRGQNVRTVIKDGEPWFVAKDVCDVLEIQNVTQALETLDGDEKMTLSKTEGHSGQRGGAQFLNVVSESGLYALIFKSRKPEAKAFRKWVTSEVLPAIRRSGSSSQTSILIGELAKLLKQNGIDIGQNRLFAWLRENGWLITRRGADYNMPTQRGMNASLFEIKERAITNPDGSVRIVKTPKITGRGQVYFVNKFMQVQGA